MKKKLSYFLVSFFFILGFWLFSNVTNVGNIAGNKVTFTLKNTQDAVKSRSKRVATPEEIYNNRFAIFENLNSSKFGPLIKYYKLTLEQVNTNITQIITDIENLEKLYRFYSETTKGEENDQWPIATVDTDDFFGNNYPTLKAAQDAVKKAKTFANNQLNNVDSSTKILNTAKSLEYKEQLNIFKALVDNDPAVTFEGETTIIVQNDNWKLKELNKATTTITNEITRLEKRYRHYSGTTKDGVNDQWPSATVNTDGLLGKDYPTLKAAQDAVTKAKTIHTDRISVLEKLIGQKNVDFMGWTYLNLFIGSVIAEIDQLEKDYRQYSEITEGTPDDQWPPNTVNTDDTPEKDYPTLLAAQKAITKAKSNYIKRVGVFNTLIADNLDGNFEGVTTVIIRNEKWDLLTLNNKIIAVFNEIIRLKEKFDELKGDSNLWAGSLLENKPNLAEAQVLVKGLLKKNDPKTKIKIAELKTLYGDCDSNSVFWTNDEIITPCLFFTDENPQVTIAQVEKQIVLLKKEIKRTKNVHLLLGGKTWTGQKTFAEAEALTKETAGVVKAVIKIYVNNYLEKDLLVEIEKAFLINGKTINKETKAKLLQASLIENIDNFSLDNKKTQWEIIVAISLGIFAIILICVGIRSYFFKKQKII